MTLTPDKTSYLVPVVKTFSRKHKIKKNTSGNIIVKFILSRFLKLKRCKNR